MVIRRKKSSRKRRGYRVHGYGRTGQHRGSGQKGGYGKAGRKSGKHKFSWILRYEPDYFGKYGFRRPNKKEFREISLLEISQLSDKWIKEGLASYKDGFIEIDLSKLGYNKVVAGGVLKGKFIIKAESFSEAAMEKIKASGSMAIAQNVST
ncbi:MAG TPA: uL15 family ribosomal protein [Geobacterales bacterium]|nr:uL15 family ribosomal protein [Geobacterales bacterium]